MLNSVIRLASAAAILVSMAAGTALSQENEGELIVYSSHPSKMVGFFTEAFGKKYGIKVLTVKAGTGVLLNRIRAEASRPASDILWGGFDDTGGSMPELFDAYQSPELVNIDPAMIDPSGYNTPVGASLMVLLVARNNGEPAKDYPKKWSDIADPKWKGLVVHADPSKSSSALAALNSWLMIYGRNDDGWAMVENMTKNMNIVLKSSLVFQQVGRGEYPVGVTYEEAAYNYASINQADIVYPEDGTLARPEGMFIVKGGPNPKAARLFADYLASKEAQLALVKNFPGRRPTRIDVDPNPKLMPLSKIKTIDYDGEWASKNRSKTLERMQKVIRATQ